MHNLNERGISSDNNFMNTNHIQYYFQDFYPINYLRNVALKFAKTDNVFLSDIDFVPGTDAYPMLKKAASHLLTSQQ